MAKSGLLKALKPARTSRRDGRSWTGDGKHRKDRRHHRRSSR